LVVGGAKTTEDALAMNDDMKRRLVYGLLSLVLSALATRLALYLTNKILGEAEENQLVG
jgi:hypothetical protein